MFTAIRSLPSMVNIKDPLDQIRADIKALRKDVDELKGDQKPTDQKPAEKK